MLKKAGIVVASATAGLLAVSPLAFAGGLISIDDNAIQIPVQACNNNVVNNVVVGIISKNNKAKSSNKGSCHQKNSADHKRR
ncbi:MAG TPA: hypothetical protein VL595_13440 [Pseudonocardia sp.]|nr:hypothetical protein [Pseudonocardia sp.]